MIAALRPLAIALATALLLSSCNDEPRPRFEEPSETPSPSESTSSAAAEKEPWEVKSKAGAVAFARHWIDVFNEAVNSGETDDLSALSSPQCVSCNGIIKRTDAIARNGGFYRTKGWRILQAVQTPGRPMARPSITLRVARSAERFRESAGDPVQANPRSEASYRAELRWLGGRWLMTELVLFA